MTLAQIRLTLFPRNLLYLTSVYVSLIEIEQVDY